MKLSEITLPLPYDECKSLALVYSYEVAQQWYAIQEEHGDELHIAVGVELPDGRWALCGDILSEIRLGGVFEWAMGRISQSLMEQIDVVPAESVLPLLAK